MRNHYVATGVLLNHFFTQDVWSQLLENHCSVIYDAILSRYVFPYRECLGAPTNRQLIEYIGNFMARYYRNEYYFRNHLLRKFFSRYGDNGGHVAAIAQMKIADSRADFVLLNGKPVVYEIKTDQDSLRRLPSQVLDYYKAFEYVCVVCGGKHLKEACELLRCSDVGILLLQDDGSFCMKKKPIRHTKDLSPEVIFNMLRKVERDYILRSFYGELPNVPTPRYVSASRAMFVRIPIRWVVKKCREALRMRLGSKVAFTTAIPDILSALAYFGDLEAWSEDKLRLFLDGPYHKTPRKRGRCNEVNILSVF